MYYLMAHEARHVYQHMQILMLLNGKQSIESSSLVMSWMNNFQNYIRNEGGKSVMLYHRQPVEVDADAFANLYVLVNGIGPAKIADVSEELVTQRIKEIGAQYGLTINE